jgi:hypothetical protein
VQLPEASVAPFISEGKLVPVLSDWSPQWSDFVLFYSSRRHVPVKLRALVDFLRKQSKQPAQANSNNVVIRVTPAHLRLQKDLRLAGRIAGNVALSPS